jgi:hypothetical protein
MSLWDDLGHFANDLLHGNLSGAAQDVNQGLHDVVTDVGGLIGGIVGGQPRPGLNVGAGIGGVDAARQAQAAQAAAQQKAQGNSTACCGRYKLESGFLVDGVTGAVWQFDAKSKSFEQIPVNRSSARQTLVDTVVENKLNVFRSRYESEFLNTVPPAQRPKLLADFEKQHLAPLRDVAKTLLY